MLFIYFQKSLQFFIKNLYEDIFMCDRSSGTVGRLLTACTSSKATNFVSNVDDNGFTNLKLNNGEYVLDVDKENNTLYFNWKNDDPSQMFQLILLSPSSCIIKNQDGCITYDNEEERYLLTSCERRTNQLFNILDNKNDYKLNKGKNKISFIKNTGFPIYGDSESTYTSACDSNGHCYNSRKKIRRREKQK